MSIVGTVYRPCLYMGTAVGGIYAGWEMSICWVRIYRDRLKLVQISRSSSVRELQAVV